MTNAIKFHDLPSLRRPVLIMGFSGWPNAGEISTGTIGYLLERLEAAPLATIDPDEFIDYTADRPTAQVIEGFIDDFQESGCRFTYARSNDDGPDLVLFEGHEPHMRWRAFSDLVLDLADRFGIRAIFTLGGTYDYVPHWIPPVVSVVYSDQRARALVGDAAKGLIPAEYNGPVSIHSMIMCRARERDIPVAGLWGHAPIYIQTGNLKVHLSLVRVLGAVAGFSLDTSDLEEAVAQMETQIEDLVSKNPRLKKYLDDMRREYPSRVPTLRPGPSISGEPDRGKVISIDSFLRRQGDD